MFLKNYIVVIIIHVVTIVTTLTITPTNIIGRNNTEVLLDCVAIGNTDNITYSWYKDNILINDHRLLTLDNGSLLINVTDYRYDNGSYHCEATNHLGNNVISNSASLLIACEFLLCL